MAVFNAWNFKSFISVIRIPLEPTMGLTYFLRRKADIININMLQYAFIRLSYFPALETIFGY